MVSPSSLSGDHPLCVVLDIDETLVSARSGVIHVRPHVKELLDCCHALRCEVVVWTAGTPAHVNAILHTLARECGRLQWFDHIISRHRCWCDPVEAVAVGGGVGSTSSCSTPPPPRAGGGVRRRKDLTQLGRPSERVLVIENNPSSVSQQPGNAVLVEDYVQPNRDDASLRELCVVLRYVVACMTPSRTAKGLPALTARRETVAATAPMTDRASDCTHDVPSAKEIAQEQQVGVLPASTTGRTAAEERVSRTPTRHDESSSRNALPSRTRMSSLPAAAARLISSARSGRRFYEARSPRTTTPALSSPTPATGSSTNHDHSNHGTEDKVSSLSHDPPRADAAPVLGVRDATDAATQEEAGCGEKATRLSCAASTTVQSAWAALSESGAVKAVDCVSAALAQAPSSLLIRVTFRRAEVDGGEAAGGADVSQGVHEPPHGQDEGEEKERNLRRWHRPCWLPMMRMHPCNVTRAAIQPRLPSYSFTPCTTRPAPAPRRDGTVVFDRSCNRRHTHTYDYFIAFADIVRTLPSFHK